DPSDSFVPLRILTTPKMTFRDWDPYKGRMVDALAKGLRIANDLANMMENESFKLLKTSGFGTFTFTGKRATWSYNPSQYIITKNFPATNDVLVPGATGSTKFGYATLDAIIDYASRRQGTTQNMEFRPTGRVRVAAKHAKDFGSEVTVTG